LFSISLERHRAEVRRAVNDERLNTIANYISGPNTSTEWSIEGRRLIPLLPRLVPQTAFTGLANTAANIHLAKNQSMVSPAATGNKFVETNGFEENFQSMAPKRRRIDSQSQVSIQGQPTIVPIKANFEPMVLQNASTLSPNQRIVSQSPTKNIVTASSSRTVLNANSYTVGTTISSPSVGQAGTRVIFVSSTPTTTTTNILNTNVKNLTAFPLIARHTIGSPQRQTIEIPRQTKQRPGRPATINTSVVGLIGVPGGQKQIKAPIIKTTLSNPSNLSVAQTVTTIPFLSGTKVFTKSGGQQQVVVFPVNQKPVTVPISQTVKAISIPSSASSSITTNTPTFIYQSAANVKNIQKVQTPNLIIMQPKQVLQTSKPLTVPTTAITLSKANIAKSQVRNQVLSTKKQMTPNSTEIKYSIEMSSNSNQSQTSNLTESPKIVAKKLQTKSLQEINASLPEFAEREIIEIDASNEAIAGLINSVKVS